MTAIAPSPLASTDLPDAPAVVGTGLRVPLVTGGSAEYANLDHAASAPCLEAVREAVEQALPRYASVHRGAGLHSQISTDAYERARASVARFVGAGEEDTVVFVRGTTDALNLLARCLPRGTTVVLFAGEHHASLLPWEHEGSRAGEVVRLPLPGGPEEAVEAARAALRAARPGPRLLCVTAASNVTGEVWPIEELALVAREEGARVVVDAAQLVPHRPFDLAACGADYVAFSGHKLYAPFGCGVLAGRADWLRAADPYLAGGGATANVTDAGVVWSDLPDRHEAGSPNVIGAVALAAACEALTEAGWEHLRLREELLLGRLRDGLAGISAVTELALWGTGWPRVAITSFVVEGVAGDLLAAALSAEYGIGVRDGLFCAHPLTRALLPEGHGRAVRASIGLGTTPEHVDRLVHAVAELVAEGPRWTYAREEGRIVPVPDLRLHG
ncbi:aminotransferase class V-fold PLP-dependent enzyme [Marinactinospora thermotolerans]|uniref:aminotransferase class V-fold PLP-dependent enzyme n=1 Tax=Marinactinospora thermotolerans TaxID=531310 RepID=UPI003D89B5A1